MKDTFRVSVELIGPGAPLFVIAGPSVIESEKLALDSAGRLAEVCEDLRLPFVFKCSFDKANRTAGDSFRGPGLKRGLQILAKVKSRFNFPVLTDVHEVAQCKPAAEVCDILQIPAFLSRQTDSIQAAARTGRCVNVKKGQFLAPWDMRHAIAKVEAAGGKKIILTERGSSFGCSNLVVDSHTHARPTSMQVGAKSFPESVKIGEAPLLILVWNACFFEIALEALDSRHVLKHKFLAGLFCDEQFPLPSSAALHHPSDTTSPTSVVD